MVGLLGRQSRSPRLADTAVIDFMLPIARWIGYGGQTNFHEGVLEPIPWATAILASTTRLRAFATVHTAFNHPVVTAKQIATMDQVAPGRAGINVVPDDVAARIAQFADAGFDGITKSFVDYVGELEYCAAEVLPAAGEVGLRAAG